MSSGSSGVMKVWLSRGEDFVDDFVAAVLQHIDLRCASRQAGIARPDSIEQKPGCLGDDLHLLKEEVVKFFFAWQKAHEVGVDRRPHGNRIVTIGSNEDDKQVTRAACP